MCCLAVFVECWGLAWGLVVWIGLLPSGIVVVDDMVGVGISSIRPEAKQCQDVNVMLNTSVFEVSKYLSGRLAL